MSELSENIDKLSYARSKVAFLADAFAAIEGNKDFTSSNLKGEFGLYLYLQELAEELKEIEDNLSKQ